MHQIEFRLGKPRQIYPANKRSLPKVHSKLLFGDPICGEGY